MSSDNKEEPKKIPLRRLGASGLKVSEICMGAMTFSNFETQEDIDKRPKGNLPVATKSVSLDIINAYYAAGGNFLDTANAYVDGDSERFIGNWIKSRSETEPDFRRTVIIATKCYFTFGPKPNDRGLSRHSIIESVEASLKRLQTSYIDLLQCHCYDRATPLEETLSTLNDLVKAGKVRYIGTSNWTASQLQRAVDICKAKDYAPITVAQMQYSLVCRQIEWEVMEVCEREGVGILAWSPLAGGLLTGRYSSAEDAPAGTRLGWVKELGLTLNAGSDKGQEWAVVRKLKELGEKKGASSSQIALKWVLNGGGGNVIPIIGARTLAHYQDNALASQITLSTEEKAELDELSKVVAPYPYAFQGMLGGVVDVAIGLPKQVAK